MGVLVKICCISSVEEANLAIAAGAKFLGLVSTMPSGPGVISDQLIAEIAQAVQGKAQTVCLTAHTSFEGLFVIHKLTQTDCLQLVDYVPFDVLNRLKEALPAVRIIQVIHIISEADVQLALEYVNHVDFLLLDSGNPAASIKELGGTGRTHNWQISQQIVEKSRVPVFLAGGLRPDNVQEAIAAVRPFGLDLCTGVRTDGKLDPNKLDRFFTNAYIA